jgi:hypothetical protein
VRYEVHDAPDEEEVEEVGSTQRSLSVRSLIVRCLGCALHLL